MASAARVKMVYDSRILVLSQGSDPTEESGEIQPLRPLNDTGLVADATKPVWVRPSEAPSVTVTITRYFPVIIPGDGSLSHNQRQV
jgi:hypothetical protein